MRSHRSCTGKTRRQRQKPRRAKCSKGGIGEDLPTFLLSAEDVGEGISVVQLIVKAGLVSSGKEAKRLIAENGAKLNDAPLSDAGQLIDLDTLKGTVKLSAGKKRHALVGIRA